EAEKLGYHSQIILSGRQINDSVGEFVADAAIREMVKSGLAPATAKVGIMGLTFKEDCPDVRNSKVEDIVARFAQYGIAPCVYDPWADADDALASYGIKLVEKEELAELDCLVVAVAHKCFREMSPDEYKEMFSSADGAGHVLIDVKGVLDKNDFVEFNYWCL
ncbi:MAG: UDP-N-acetyl-D-galactosamine dehydrogenase, partial [Methanosphaera sp. rholeuAM270]